MKPETSVEVPKGRRDGTREYYQRWRVKETGVEMGDWGPGSRGSDFDSGEGSDYGSERRRPSLNFNLLDNDLFTLLHFYSLKPKRFYHGRLVGHPTSGRMAVHLTKRVESV